jgi:putative hemolysin
MKLIDTDDILKSARLNHIVGVGAAKLLMSILKLNTINKIYAKFANKSGYEFINALIEELEIKYEINPEDLERIPKEGAFIIVANHPYGGLEGLIMFHSLLKIRPDIHIMGNYVLKGVDQIKDLVFPVSIEEENGKVKSSFAGTKHALTHLQNGGCLVIFPAGEISTFVQDSNGIMDKIWSDGSLRLIKKQKVPIVPIYFHGTNSKLFHFLGLIHPKLRKAKIPSELLNKKNKTIYVRIGNPIPVKDQNDFPDISRYGRFLRAKTYALGTRIEVKKFFQYAITPPVKVEDIIDPLPKDKILEEIAAIEENHMLFNFQDFKVYCAPSSEIPTIMMELGRLREVTFREVGEGTNLKIDIDEYDIYYHQLFIWDTIEQCIVGAYRIGKGKSIMEQYGVKGFYIQSLFRIEPQFNQILKQAIELGRSFIVKEYQRKPLSLFLLWKGILYFLLKNPEYRYLVGPVSISNRFSEFSKSIIIEFIQNHYFNEKLAAYIKPRKPFVPNFGNVDKDILFESAKDLNKIDKVIKDAEVADFRVPVLLKKYLQLGGKIACFNIDPKFNDSLDGLMVMDLYDVPIEVITTLSKEVNDDSILERFNINIAEQYLGYGRKKDLQE